MNTVYTSGRLEQEAREHEAFINRIKAEVAQEVKIADQDVPLFSQLTPADPVSA